MKGDPFTEKADLNDHLVYCNENGMAGDQCYGGGHFGLPAGEQAAASQYDLGSSHERQKLHQERKKEFHLATAKCLQK